MKTLTSLFALFVAATVTFASATAPATVGDEIEENSFSHRWYQGRSSTFQPVWFAFEVVGHDVGPGGDFFLKNVTFQDDHSDAEMFEQNGVTYGRVDEGTDAVKFKMTFDGETPTGRDIDRSSMVDFAWVLTYFDASGNALRALYWTNSSDFVGNRTIAHSPWRTFYGGQWFHANQSDYASAAMLIPLPGPAGMAVAGLLGMAGLRQRRRA